MTARCGPSSRITFRRCSRWIAESIGAAAPGVEGAAFKAVLDDDMKALAAGGETGIVAIIMATNAGMTTDEFHKTVLDWLATARHPRFTALDRIKPIVEKVGRSVVAGAWRVSAPALQRRVIRG